MDRKYKKITTKINEKSTYAGLQSSVARLNNMNRKDNKKTDDGARKVKTSTPKRETDRVENCANLSTISNISCIAPQPENLFSAVPANENRSSCFVQSAAGRSQHSKKKLKNISENEECSENQMLDIKYSELLQTMLLNKIAGETFTHQKDKIDEKLESLQKRINENIEITNNTKERIKRIEFNHHTESALKQHRSDLQKSADLANKFNLSDNINKTKAVNKELERMQNNLACEKTVIPETIPGVAKLFETMTDAVSAHESLPKEPFQALDEVKEINESLEQSVKDHEAISKIKKNCLRTVPQVKCLVLENYSNKINREMNGGNNEEELSSE